MIKKYTSIYEGLSYSGRSDDSLVKEFIEHNSREDYEEAVNEIRIIDIRYEDEEYLNLHRYIDGNPRLSSKSGNFSAFAESCETNITVRSVTENNKTTVRYIPKKHNNLLCWKEGRVSLVELYDNPDNRNLVRHSTYKILEISAKSLKIGEMKDKNRQAKARDFRKMGKVKFTNGNKWFNILLY